MLLLQRSVIEDILWCCILAIHTASVESIFCYSSSEGDVYHEEARWCQAVVHFIQERGNYTVTHYTFMTDVEEINRLGPDKDPESIQYVPKCSILDYEDYHPSNEEDLSQLEDGKVICSCNTSIICATKPETYEVYRGTNLTFEEEKGIELIVQWLRSGLLPNNATEALERFMATTIQDAATTTTTTTYTTTAATMTTATTSMTATPTSETEATIASTTTLTSIDDISPFITTTSSETEAVSAFESSTTSTVSVAPDIDDSTTETTTTPYPIIEKEVGKSHDTGSSFLSDGLPVIIVAVVCLVLLASAIALVVRKRKLDEKADVERRTRRRRQPRSKDGQSKYASVQGPVDITKGMDSAEKALGSKEPGAKGSIEKSKESVGFKGFESKEKSPDSKEGAASKEGEAKEKPAKSKEGAASKEGEAKEKPAKSKEGAASKEGEAKGKATSTEGTGSKESDSKEKKKGSKD
nr:unnamed protein product [Haemonchus contortus]